MYNLDIEDVFMKSWERWTEQLGQVVLLSLLYLVGLIVLMLPFFVLIFAVIFAGAFGAIFGGEEAEVEEMLATLFPGAIIGLALMILAMLMILPAWAGGYLHALKKILLGEKATFSDLFSQFPKLGHLLLASIIMGIIILIGFLLFIIPGLVFAVLLSQTLLLIIDRNMDFASAIASSWTRVAKDFWLVTGILVLLFMANFGVNMVLGLLPGIGAIVGVLMVTPYFVLADWVLYFALFPRVEPKQEIRSELP